MNKCIISFQDREVIKKIEDMGYICYNTIPSNLVSAPICAHSDVLYQKLNSDTIIISSCQKENSAVLEKAGYKVEVYDGLKPGYKTECKLNFIINNNIIISNPRTAMKIENRIKHISVNQGYTKCSTLCVNENAYITDDENIYHTLIKNNLDCLKIEKGDIQLAGYNYGFIGGASVKLNEKEILFFGDIENVADKSNIISFLDKYNMKRIFMENKKLVDIGSGLIF